MGHPPRNDEPGSWHHLMNRGIGHRTLFDVDEDGRNFLALVARVSREGLLKPVAFSFLPNHFHLLVWSPEGRLGDAMRYIESVYARGFNRVRGRDGSLVRARYRSKVVRSDAYRRALISYIDQNPVDAKLVVDPFSYPFGSARLYANSSGPRWLDRGWVEEYSCRLSGRLQFDVEAYERAFGGSGRAARSRWMGAAMESSRPDDPTLDQLIAATPQHVRRWLDERAMLSDGTGRHLPVADAASVVEVVAVEAQSMREWHVIAGKRKRPAWTILTVALLRDLAGLSIRQIAVRLALSQTRTFGMYTAHRGLLGCDALYAALATTVTRSVIDRCHRPAA